MFDDFRLLQRGMELIARMMNMCLVWEIRFDKLYIGDKSFTDFDDLDIFLSGAEMMYERQNKGAPL